MSKYRKISESKIASQRPTAAKREGNWGTEPAVRIYGYSPSYTALQIRGKIDVPSGPSAYAQAYLNDADLVWLLWAIFDRIKERGVADAGRPDTSDESDREPLMSTKFGEPIAGKNNGDLTDEQVQRLFEVFRDGDDIKPEHFSHVTRALSEVVRGRRAKRRP